LPSLYRSDCLKYSYDEETLFERFRALATPLVSREPRSVWEWYFLARHHGLPSRLLDWTESLAAAAYFALESDILQLDRPTVHKHAEKTKPRRSFDRKSPVVWVLDAGTLNRYSRGAQNDDVLVADDELSNYLPGQVHVARSNRWPVALLPDRTSDRIVAQQATFTLHGRDTTPLEDLAVRKRRALEIHLAKIVLDSTAIFHIWEELDLLGISKRSLFPDLDSVARDIRWDYQNAPLGGQATGRRKTSERAMNTARGAGMKRRPPTRRE
jgi:hypothetical protein